MNRSRKLSGFTLIELLIVVAIIGTLATMGVPAYKRMVERAKTKEAQVALGGVYTSNVAFQSEYGTFGSNLAGIGFDFEGSGANYVVGFPDANCGQQGIMPADPGVMPPGGYVSPASGMPGAQVASSFDAYYRGRTCTVAGRGVSFPATGNACTTPTASCLSAQVDTVAGGYFAATATGCIRTGCTPTSPVGGGAIAAPDPNTGFVNNTTGAVGSGIRKDAWAMDHRRRLIRWSDGGS